MEQDVKEQFEKMDQRFDELLVTIKDGFDEVTGRLDVVEGDVKVLKDDVKILKSTAVTKDYFDDKLADLGAEIGKRINAMMEKERAFHKKLIEILRRHNIIAPEEIKELEEMAV